MMRAALYLALLVTSSASLARLPGTDTNRSPIWCDLCSPIPAFLTIGNMVIGRACPDAVAGRFV